MSKAAHRARIERIRSQAYTDKVQEYMKLSLEELHAIYNDPKKRVGGSYRQALVDVTAYKFEQEAIKKSSTKIDDSTRSEQTDDSLQREQEAGSSQEGSNEVISGDDGSGEEPRGD